MLRLLIFEIIGMISSGIVIKLCWQWFIVTTFGLDPLKLTEAIGLGILVSLMTYSKDILHSDDDDDEIDRFFHRLLFLGNCFWFSFVIHLFMELGL